ncbi:MAG: ABC transporter ATP-binding protein, partial [Desulfosarcina sp.]|nr:ABC transporter ATP-binding protein [Desulfobacterales bacterium]
GIDLTLRRGEILGLVGESGSGKSLFARSLLRLESPAAVRAGSILLDGRELTVKTQKQMRALRGKKIALVLQNPESAMDPVFTMGYQFREVLLSQEKSTSRGRKAGFSKIERFLDAVGIASARKRCRQYPHEWSRGMLQRGKLAMVFSTRPAVAILDEITSALDPTVCLQVLDAIRRLKEKSGTAIMLISHDLFLAAEICDRVAVMKAGRIVETGTVREIFDGPVHPYTRALVSSAR